MKVPKRIAIYVDQYLGTDYAKMAYGLMRYKPNEIVCAIDTRYHGRLVSDVTEYPFDVPIVKDVARAVEMGTNTLVLGIAPSGGGLPEAWDEPIRASLKAGLSVWNGLHDYLASKYEHLVQYPGQKIWDIRKPGLVPEVGRARAALLDNMRILTVGTDMAIGKMTVGLELYDSLKKVGANVDFLATGQIGITITGSGIPLDSYIVDQACGAVENMVLSAKDNDVLIIEGQGSLLHPGSTATLPLMRGSCPTHLILCHKANKTHLRNPERIAIPDLKEFIALNEALASSCSTLPKPKCIGMALNTSLFTEEEAQSQIENWESKLDLPVTDVVRYGCDKLIAALGINEMNKTSNN